MSFRSFVNSGNTPSSRSASAIASTFSFHVRVNRDRVSFRDAGTGRG